MPSVTIRDLESNSPGLRGHLDHTEICGAVFYATRWFKLDSSDDKDQVLIERLIECNVLSPDDQVQDIRAEGPYCTFRHETDRVILDIMGNDGLPLVVTIEIY